MEEVKKVSPSIVNLRTTAEFYDEKFTEKYSLYISAVNGTIFYCEEDKSSGLYHSLILTSADVLRPHVFQGGLYHSYASSTIMKRHVHGKNNLIQEVFVELPTKKEQYKCEVVAFDDHYNIAVVLLKSNDKLPTASLMCIDDRISVGVPDVSTTSPLYHMPNYSKVAPDDQVVVVGRSRFKGNLIVCSGKYSADHLGFELHLENLFRIGCKAITNGGPVIDSAGNVIGIAFGCYRCTACLPINIFLKWWMHFNTYKEICRPCLGITVADLFLADLQILAPVHLLGITDGVIVEEVKSGSPAYVAGIRPNDVIFCCGGRLVRSFLEFFELIWDKKGEVVEAMGIRNGSLCSFIIKIDTVKPEVLLETSSAGQSIHRTECSSH